MVYASFWKRVCASIVDSVIYFIILMVLSYLVAPMVSPESLHATVGCLAIGLFLFYFVWTESSAWQATLGKKLSNLKVTDLEGRRISFLRSLFRYLAMYLSNLIFGIGYLMCLWTERQQCLHDICAGCLVLETPESYTYTEEEKIL